jgi:hypothetical protein
MREQQINQLYYRELFGSIFIYVIVLFTVSWIAKDLPDGATRTMLALTPMLPALGVLWAILRYFKRTDEYLRIWSLECIAMAGALTAVFSLTYGFLESVGFPRLSMFVIWGVFMGGWGVIACLRKSMEK